LLYVINESQSSPIKSGIYSIDITGLNNLCVVQDVCPWYLTVSDDMEYMLFTDNGYIHRVNIDGSNHVLLAESYNTAFFPSITPNNEKILYEYDVYPYIMNFNGSDKYKLVNNRICSLDSDHKISYFLNNFRILITLEKQIN